MKRVIIVVLLTVSAALANPGSNFNVNCSKGEKINTLLKTLTRAATTGPITVTFSGTCKESVSINNFERLTLVGKPGAVIDGPSKNVNPAIEIGTSHFVILQGFTVTGGYAGIWCLEYSVCLLTGLTVQNATGDGVYFARSEGLVDTTVIQNNGSRGIALVNGAKALVIGTTIQGNAAAGVAVVSGSNLTMQNSIVQNNAGFGVRALLGSAVRLYDNTISGNGGSGVSLEAQSNGSLEQSNTGNVITGNAGSGVALQDLSFARFAGVNNISGNLGQPDVACNPQFSATRGADTVGGTTNCVEPDPAKQQK